MSYIHCNIAVSGTLLQETLGWCRIGTWHPNDATTWSPLATASWAPHVDAEPPHQKPATKPMLTDGLFTPRVFPTRTMVSSLHTKDYKIISLFQIPSFYNIDFVCLRSLRGQDLSKAMKSSCTIDLNKLGTTAYIYIYILYNIYSVICHVYTMSLFNLTHSLLCFGLGP